MITLREISNQIEKMPWKQKMVYSTFLLFSSMVVSSWKLGGNMHIVGKREGCLPWLHYLLWNDSFAVNSNMFIHVSSSVVSLSQAEEGNSTTAFYGHYSMRGLKEATICLQLFGYLVLLHVFGSGDCIEMLWYVRTYSIKFSKECGWGWS